MVRLRKQGTVRVCVYPFYSVLRTRRRVPNKLSPKSCFESRRLIWITLSMTRPTELIRCLDPRDYLILVETRSLPQSFGGRDPV